MRTVGVSNAVRPLPVNHRDVEVPETTSAGA
jgi:hypothetical protein